MGLEDRRVENPKKTDPGRKERDDLPEGSRPPYEPPRITKKRSVARATLFTGGGPPSTGITGFPP
jgi:hypothetical protein